MRSYVVTALLAAMMAVFVLVLVKRPRTAHVAPSPVSGLTSAAPSVSASAPVAKIDGGSDAQGDAPKVEKLLRVATLGWEIAAPALVENDGLSPGPKNAFGKDEVEVHLAPAEQASKIEAMLARGGDDPDGADVAVLPLASFVASYERLRALDPRVFLVVAWSRGREAIVVAKEGAIASLGERAGNVANDEVRVVSSNSEPANMMALTILDLAGVPMTRTKLVTAGSKDATGAQLSAIDRASSGAPTKLLLTSADVRLVPIVAIAPRGVIERRTASLRALSKGWFEGLERVKKDAPGAARAVAGTKGAPEAIALLERLGQLEPSNLRDDAQLLGLSGRGALTIARLFTRIFQIDRSLGVLTAPPPEEPPLDTTIVSALVRADPSLSSTGETAKDAAPEPAIVPAPKGATLLFARKIAEPKLDAEALALDLAFLTATFDRATVRVAVRGGAKAAKPIVLDARERFAAHPTRLVIIPNAAAFGAAGPDAGANLGAASALVEVWIGL